MIDNYRFLILINGSTIDNAEMIVQFADDGASRLLSLTDNTAKDGNLTKSGLNAIKAYSYIAKHYLPRK